jgi:cytoskeletal protein RodZ
VKSWFDRRSRLQKWSLIGLLVIVVATVVAGVTARQVTLRNLEQSQQPTGTSQSINDVHAVSLASLRGSTVDHAESVLKIRTNGNMLRIAAVVGFNLPGDKQRVPDAALSPMVITATCVDETTPAGATLYVGVVDEKNFSPEVRANSTSSSQALDIELKEVAGCKQPVSQVIDVFVKND